MKAIFSGFIVLSLIGLIGCTSSSDKVGGPGATNTTDKSPPLGGPKEGTFHLNPPRVADSIKQSASDVVTISIDRGKNFDEDVALAFEDVPDHVTLDPKISSIKKGEKEAKVTVKVGEKAGLGKHDIKVIGKPTKGDTAETHFTINVKEK
jgi:hypothetical protein